jgi:hypothetical protein
MGSVAAGAGVVRCPSCDHAGRLASKANPKQIESKILMVSERLY